MKSPCLSPSLVASAASSSSGGSPVTAIAAITVSPTLVTELSPQAVAGTFSYQVIVASPTQTVFSPVSAAFAPTRTIASASLRAGHKYFRDDDRSSPD